MNLIWIDDYTLHNMDNGVTYERATSEGDYAVSCRGAHQHDDRNFKMDNIITTGESAKVFWEWLRRQSVIPMPRPQSLMPEVDAKSAPVETPRKFKAGDTPFVIAPKRSRVGGTIIVQGYTIDGAVEDEQGNTYRESELDF